MSLRTKLFISHASLVLISVILAGVIAAYVASSTFSGYFQLDERTIVFGENSEVNMTTVETEIQGVDSAFSFSLFTGLGLATLIATVIASIISYFLAKRLTNPISDMLKATGFIAEGHYKQRVQAAGDDEIAHLAEQFNIMAQGLDEIETSRQQLLEDVTHELSTPLTSIRGYVEAIQDNVMQADDSTLRLISNETIRLQGLIHDLQQLSSFEKQDMSLNLESLYVDTVVRQVADKLAIQFKSKSVQLDILSVDTGLKVCGDADRITQILTNILGNALQYTPENGWVSISVHAIDNLLEFRIVDSGIGLKEADLNLIFQRFYRVDKSRSRRHGGSGIGLTIARHLVELHGGQIHAESQGIGKGSTFIFTLLSSTTL